VRQRPWLIALAAGTALVAGLPWLTPLAGLAAVQALLDWPGLCGLAVLVAAVVHLASPRGRRATVWSHALALLAGAVFALRVATLIEYGTFSSGMEPAGMLLGGAEAVALLAVGLPLSVNAAQALNRLPQPPAGSAAWSAPARELDPT
jgi:hypothetical protein